MASGAPLRDPLVALREGNPAPFEEFVRRRTRALVAYFAHRGASLSRAEDLTQEVFLKLYRCAARYQPQERFSSFCFRVARNVWIDDCRKAPSGGGDSPQVEVEDLGSAVEPTPDFAVQEEQQRVTELLARLPPAHRRVFELVLLGELSYGEISVLLSIPLGTVKSRMFHAVRRLRQAWSEAREHEGVA